MDCTVHRVLQARIQEWVAFPFSRGSSLPGIELGSPALQVDSLPAEPQGKPKNTGVGSLSLLQGIFLTQESSWDLLHCRRILYQLSYQGYQGSLIAGKRFRNLLGMHYSYEKLHCTLHKIKDVNHHIIHTPALPTCITTAGMCSIFLPKMQSTTTIKIP